ITSSTGYSLAELSVTALGDYVYYGRIQSSTITLTRIDRFNNSQTVVATITEALGANDRIRLHSYQNNIYIWVQNSGNNQSSVHIYNTINGTITKSAYTQASLGVTTGVAFGDNKM